VSEIGSEGDVPRVVGHRQGARKWREGVRRVLPDLGGKKQASTKGLLRARELDEEMALAKARHKNHGHANDDKGLYNKPVRRRDIRDRTIRSIKSKSIPTNKRPNPNPLHSKKTPAQPPLRRKRGEKHLA